MIRKERMIEHVECIAFVRFLFISNTKREEKTRSFTGRLVVQIDVANGLCRPSKRSLIDKHTLSKVSEVFV